MGEISSLPDEIIHNILVRLPLNLLVKPRYVCKRWNRLLSDPFYGPRGDRKILLPFAPINVDVLDEENDTTRSMVPFSSPPFAKPKFAIINSKCKVVTFAGSCNGIVLLVIHHDCRGYRCIKERARIVVYNPLTREYKMVSDDQLHYNCNTSYKHAYGFGSGSTPDDLKIVRFRGSNNKRHTFDVFSFKTNSWTVLKKFFQNSYWLNCVGTLSNGSLHWMTTSRYNKDHQDQSQKIVALDIKNMVASDIHLPFLDRSSYNEYSCVLGTLHGSLCIFTNPRRNQFAVWVMTAREGGEKSWLEASSFTIISEWWNLRNSPVIILDNGMVLISIENQLRKLVIYDTMKHSHKVIDISERPSYIRRSHGIEYVERLVSPSSLFNNIA